MIYTSEECNIIYAIKERKELERSIYNAMDALPIGIRMAFDCQLQLDIRRCESM